MATTKTTKSHKHRRAQASRRKLSLPDLDSILNRLSESLSIIATATSALIRVQDQTGTIAPQDVGDEITTLEHGTRALRSAYDELDVALREVRP